MSTDTTDTMNQDSVADDWAQALEEQAASGGAADSAPAFDAPNAPAAPASGAGAGTSATQDIHMVLDIPVQLSVELGRVKVPISSVAFIIANVAGGFIVARFGVGAIVVWVLCSLYYCGK